MSTSTVFGEDDEEIWKKVVDVDDSIAPLLPNLAVRIQEDWNIDGGRNSSLNNTSSTSDGESYWERLTNNNRNKNRFAYSNASTKAIDTSVSNTNDDSIPEAFKTEEGEKHLSATTALLGLSRQRSVQVTMGALRSVDTTAGNSSKDKDDKHKNDNFSSLLGSRELLVKTLTHHHRQRSARLSVLTECLRLEQDEFYPIRAVVTKELLDPLDESFLNSNDGNNNNNNNKARGIFKSLLIVSCQPDPVVTRESLEPIKVLRINSTINTLVSSSSSSLSSSQRSINSFGSTLIAEIEAQTSRERTQAMEGLLALLYQRLQGGICREDYALLFTAFFSGDNNRNNSNKQEDRWNQLAGLICAECMALWRVFEQGSSTSSIMGWTAKHPLLIGLETEEGKNDIEALALLHLDTMSVNALTSTSSSHGKRPQSIAFLSCGLLLCLANDDVIAITRKQLHLTPGVLSSLLWDKKCDENENDSPKSLREYGDRMVQIANDEGGAYDFLIDIVKSLAGEALVDSSPLVAHDAPYDWQFSSRRRQQKKQQGTPVLMLLNQASDGTDGDSTADMEKVTMADTNVSADILVYTSIAREIIASSIAAFSETLLTIDRSNSCRNIGMLSQLVAAVFRNNKPLCQQFWDSWELYIATTTTQEDQQKGFPICRLMDTSYNLINSHLQALSNGKISKNEFVSAAASFFLLSSALWNTPTTIETMIGMLSKNLFRTAMACCCGPPNYEEEHLQNITILLESFQALTRIPASSNSCLQTLRMLLEDVEHQIMPATETETQSFDGPRLLALILYNQQDSRITQSVLGIIANLLEGAPRGWAILLAGQFTDNSVGGDSAISLLIPFIFGTNEEQLSNSAVSVLAALIGHMSSIVFGDSNVPNKNDATIVAFLQSLSTALLSAMTGLCLATTCTTTASVSVETADIILQSFANFLKFIRPVITLHESSKVRLGATLTRDSLITALANSNGLGEVIVYYATLPASLGVVVKMEETIVDQSISEQVARDDNSETVKKYGPWYSLSSECEGNTSDSDSSRYRVLDALSEMTPSDFDLEGAEARGLTKDKSSDGVATLNATWSSMRLLSEWVSHVEDIAKTHLEVLPSAEHPLTDKANDIIQNLSPQRLLCTVAPMPISCRADSKLAAFWQTLDISTFDLLLPYLHPEVKTEASLMPASIVLDLINACITHAKLSVPKVDMANSMLLHIALRSARLSKLLFILVERGIRLAKEEHSPKKLTGKNDDAFLNTFLSFRILSSCVASAPTVADAILGLEENCGLTKVLVDGAMLAPKVLNLKGSQGIFTTEASILQIRMAAGCMDVLSALWKNTRFLSQGTSDQVRSSLTKEADRQSSFILELVEFVSDYTNSKNLDARITISNETELGRVSTMSFMTSAFEVLANAHVYDASKEGDTNTATSNILLGFVQSRRLLGSKNFQMSVASTKQIWKIAKHFGLKQEEPLSFLSSFPATSSNLQPHDFYLKENSFNMSSLAQWLVGTGMVDVKNNDLMNDMNDELDKASLLHHLSASELHLMESWKYFLEIAVYKYKMYSSNDCTITGSSLQILDVLALDTLHSLNANLHDAVTAQAGVSVDFMIEEIFQMSSCLSDLLLFLLEFGAFNSLPLEELIEISKVLAQAMASRQKIGSFQQTEEHSQNRLLEVHCYQQQTLLSCALVLCSLIERREHSRPNRGVQQVYTSLCLTNCKLLKSFEKICNKENMCNKVHTTIIRSCASLFTLLVIGYEGDLSSTSSYTRILSNSFSEYEVLKQLMNYATDLSCFVKNNLSSSNNPIPSVEDTEILEVIKSIFNLLYAIADTNDPEMISTLHGVELPQLVVRNPLFNLRASSWSHQSKEQPRGYIFKNEPMMLMCVGSEDPIYGIWLGSMQVLGACVRTSSHWLNVSGSNNLGTGFLDMSIEFLRVYRIPLLECLKSCCASPSTKMTRLALREAKVLVGMVAELCKRNVRSSFVHSNLELCEEFINGSKDMITRLSQFLGATGTSCELFATITEYKSTDQDRLEEQNKTPLSQIRLSLLSEGVPGAQQKAVWLSDFASKRLKKLSQDDFTRAVVIPDHLKALSQESNKVCSWEKLDQNCRLSVTNSFSLDLVRAAADCVRQALSLITRTHSYSSSFFIFSEADRTKTNFMSLVEIGIVIGYRPNVGQGIRFDSSDFESLRFGKVLSSNTHSRTWEVKVIRQEGFDHDVVDGRQETVTADQLSGIEDKSTRKPSTSSVAPAPDSITEFKDAPVDLATGNYILILRWCHQQTALFSEGNSLDTEFKTPFYIQQIAEQASILLGADLILHELNGAFKSDDLKFNISQLDDQIFELFADKAALEGNIENEPLLSYAPSFPEGRLKGVIDRTVWNGLQSQVRPFIQRAWKRRQEIERQRNEKRMRSGSGGTEFSWDTRSYGGRRTSFRR